MVIIDLWRHLGLKTATSRFQGQKGLIMHLCYEKYFMQMV